ncbi:ferredoxin [Streptomyces sp. NPDC050433]|uniref:ferredoxin n=1 Tax=unclassified Streptomyces TaxID=2593676 RepID=UPI0034160B4A
MKVEVEQSKCVASGQCAMTAPTVFDQNDDDGTVVVLDPVPAAPVHGQTRQAAAMCPGSAIVLHDAP